MPDLTISEFIRGTRSVGEPSAPGSDHERVMRPLRVALQECQVAGTLEAQVDAFDPTSLEQAWRALIAEFAVERHPRSIPDQRALTEELTHLGDAVWVALAELTVAARWARVATYESMAVAEEARTRWIEAVAALFAAVDRWWGAIVPVLAEATGRRGAFWRRVLQRSA